MTRGPCKFKQQDVARALRAAKKAGVDVTISFPNGVMEIKTGKCENSPPDTTNPWDGILGNAEDKKRAS